MGIPVTNCYNYPGNLQHLCKLRAAISFASSTNGDANDVDNKESSTGDLDMQRFVQLACVLALTVAGATAADAGSWKRERQTTGPYGGQWGVSGSGSCANGSCASNQRWTGPRGNSITREGSTHCSGDTCEGTATWTGPLGNKVTTKRKFQRY